MNSTILHFGIEGCRGSGIKKCIFVDPNEQANLIKLHDTYFEPYLAEEQIQEAVSSLAEKIAADYKDEVPIFVGVLNGSFMFVSDFLKAYPYPCEVTFVKLSSYQGLTSTGIVETLLDVSEDINGRSVVILEDIIDTGRTLQELVHLFTNTNVKEFRIASLFYKSEIYNGEYNIDYVGLEIPNRYIVGYGLDYNELGRNLTAVYQLKQTNMMNLVIFGKPGAGKGTQASILKEKYNLVHISTGDLFRYNMKNATALGQLAQSYIDKGDLVPDQVTIDMLQEEVDRNPEADGFIFDGFPRTIAQAEALDQFLQSKGMMVNGCVALEAEDDVLAARLIERGKESGRSDDQDPEKIQNRFNEYREKTAPLRHFYTAQGKFHSISGIGAIEEITERLSAIIDQLPK